MDVQMLSAVGRMKAGIKMLDYQISAPTIKEEIPENA